MRVITELELRDQYKQEEFSSFRVPADTRLTPAAQQFLSERRIPVISDDSGKPKTSQKISAGQGLIGQDLTGQDSSAGYAVLATGETMSEKPENMTHINGKYLVMKNHPRIRFRGKLDLLEAMMISAILEVEGHGYLELAKDLTEVLDYLRNVMSAEVRERPLEPLNFHGLTPSEIREHSHYPHRHYGVSHILPQPRHGKLMARLNTLRAQSRELELAAIDAFCTTREDVERPDILEALNRLSSLFYIMMIQMGSGHYKVGC